MSEIVKRWAAILLAAGVMAVIWTGVPVLDRAGRGPLPGDVPCEKCGSKAIKLRYCGNHCSTFHMTVEQDGNLKITGPLMWGYEHLHRSCTTCTWDGTAMDCSGDNSQTGVGSIDLTGVPFVVTASWNKGGNNPGGAATKMNGGRVVAITGGGNCGWDAPAGSPSNPFNTFGGSSILGLAYMP